MAVKRQKSFPLTPVGFWGILSPVVGVIVQTFGSLVPAFDRPVSPSLYAVSIYSEECESYL